MTEESKANFFEPDGITYINNILSSSKERKEKENKENFERYNDFKIDKNYSQKSSMLFASMIIFRQNSQIS